MLVRWLVPVSAIVLGAACSFAPHYARPATQAPPPAYQEQGGWALARPADEQGRGPWWEIYGDPQLNQLIED